MEWEQHMTEARVWMDERSMRMGWMQRIWKSWKAWIHVRRGERQRGMVYSDSEDAEGTHTHRRAAAVGTGAYSSKMGVETTRTNDPGVRRRRIALTGKATQLGNR